MTSVPPSPPRRARRAPAAPRRISPKLAVLAVAAAVLLQFGEPVRIGAQGATQRASALVLVNSTSPNYGDFARYTKPYLDHFGVAYTVANIASGGVPANIGTYAVVVVAHRSLDRTGTFLTASAQAQISTAVQQGTGLVNFDYDLTTGGGAPAYQYVQDVFGFAYNTGSSSAAAAVQSSASVGNYVVGLQAANASYTLRRAITPQGVSPGSGSSTLLTLGGQPLLVARTFGSGRALQWTSYEWLRADTWGYTRGWDDLIWRGFVWAARKPFVLQGMPAFATMRVDDTTGPYWWTGAAVQQGFKPWLGVFLDEQDGADSAAIHTLTAAGNATASIHARTYDNFFYFNHNFGNGSELPAATVQQNFADATAWHTNNQIPISKFVLPHFYEMGTNVFAGLQNWGVQFVATLIQPGQPLGATTPRLFLGPYNLFENPCNSDCAEPVYYADYLSVPGHSEFDGRFFNSFQEVRDDAGYEWYPSGDIPVTVGRAVRQMARGFTGMNIATLFTHENYIQFIQPADWTTIMNQVGSGIAPYSPEFVTMDFALQYARAVKTSDISSSLFDPSTGLLTTTMSGSTDMQTRIQVFTESSGQIQRTYLNVPTFSGSTTVNTNLGGGSTQPTLSIDDVTLSEGNSGTKTATFTVTLTGSYSGTVTVNYATANGTAVAPGDYTATSGTLSFSGGATTRTVNVTIIGDTTVEPDETFTVGLSGPSGATIADGSGLGTITNDDGVSQDVYIDVWNDANQTPVLATTTDGAQLNATDNQWTEFLWPVRGYPGVFAGTTETPPLMHFFGAVPNGTYTLSAGLYWNNNLRYYWGTTAAAPEQFTVDVTAGVNGEFSEYPLGQVTVTNGVVDVYTRRADALPGGSGYPFWGWAWLRLQPVAGGLPTLAINDVTVTEGNSGTKLATFTVTLTGSYTGTVTANYATANGTAVAPGDYTATSGTVTFSGGATTQTVNVTIVGDTTAEPDETFTVNLSNPVGATIADGTGVGTITNDDAAALPTLAINDVSVAEGNSGTKLATFTVSLTGAYTGTVTASYATANGTAVAPGDYTATSGTVTFSGGATTQTVNVTIIGDTTVEPDETFTVGLSNPVGATIADATGVGTIANDDGADIRIDVWNDANQTPVLATTTDGAQLNATDNQWTEFLWPVRGYPGVFAATGETPPVMRFYGAAPNGTYTVQAGLYWNDNLRYYWGTSAAAPEQFTVDVTSGVNGEFAEYPLGQVTVTNGVFELYTRRADALPGGTGYPFWGWAWIRLVPTAPATPTLAINDVTVTEGNSGTKLATFTVTLAGSYTGTVTVSYATANGTAVAPGDYTATSGTLSFSGGATTQTVNVTIVGDTAVEADETFTVGLSNPVGATIADGTGVGTITNDDAAALPTLAINDVTVTEGNSGTKLATFTVTLAGAYTGTVTANYATANGTAVAPGDYTATSGTVTFSGGATTQTVNVTIIGDTTVEPDETFTVGLSNPVGATIADGTGVGTIANDDVVVLPTLSINDVSITEGNSGTKTATFTVTLTGSYTGTVTVGYATANGTAVSMSDYLPASGTLSFSGGATTRSVNVTILGNTTVEPDETFTVNLSNPVGATIADGTGVGTILNDDGPRLSVNDVSVTEGNSGTKNAAFTVRLTGSYSGTVTVSYATVNGTAVAPGDYTAASGTVSFSGGATTRTVNVSIVGDTTVEPNETFTLVLSNPVNATITDGTGVGTITNDDTAAQPTLAINDVTLAEGNSGTKLATFTVTLTGSYTGTVTVNYATANGTAVAPGDYTAASGTLTFSGGATTQTVNVTIVGDTAVEPDETFTVGLSAPSGATIADGTGVGTITNDDAAALPTLAINDVAVTEGNSGTKLATFTVTLAGAYSGTVTVNYATANGTAVAPGDYTAASGTLSFSGGATTRSIDVTIVGDTAVESNETFTVGLSNPSGATIADGTGVGTITNDDSADIRIDVWNDANQSPVLATTSDGGQLNTTDNQWTEFLWPVRGYPGVFAATGEAPPLMRFSGAVPNGTYTLSAGLYWNDNLRYYWGTTAAAPEQFTLDVTSGANGDFAEYTLGQVTVTNGVVEIYTRRADALPGGTGYPFWGWAWLRLRQVP